VTRAGRELPLGVPLLLLLALPACTGGSAPQAPPHIAFGETAYDFRQVEAGTALTHEFAFHNTGGRELRIDNIRTSCNCTAAVAPARIVPAGGDARLRVSMQSAGAAGVARETVSVYSNDPAQPLTTLAVSATISADISADPASMYVGHLRRGQHAAAAVRLLANNPAARLGPVEVTGSSITAQLAATAHAPELRLAVADNAPLGAFHDTVIVHTSSPTQPVLRIPVVGRIDGDVIAAPAALAFGAVRSGDAPVRTFAIRNHGSAGLRLSVVGVEPPIADARLIPLQAGQRYRVDVTLRPSAGPGRVEGTVQLQTSSGEQPRIGVPFTARVVSR